MYSTARSSTENKEVYHSDNDHIFMVCKVIVGFSFIVVSQPAILILHFMQTADQQGAIFRLSVSSFTETCCKQCCVLWVCCVLSQHAGNYGVWKTFPSASCVKRRSASGAYLLRKYWQKLTVRKRRIDCVCLIWNRDPQALNNELI